MCIRDRLEGVPGVAKTLLARLVARGDKPYKIPMKRFDTENTVHINAIEIEESAEKRRSVAAGHRCV